MQLLKIVFFITTLSLFHFPALAESASSKAEAARLAQIKTSGQVLKVEQHGSIYKVKILQESGRVVSVIIKKAGNKQRKGNAE